MSLRSSGDELVTVSSDCILLWDLKVCVAHVIHCALQDWRNAMLCSLITTDRCDVTLQKLTRKKALGTGPNCALQAEYALDGSVLITVLKVWYETHHLQPVLSAAGYIV